MANATQVFCRLRFEALHHWPGAFGTEAYLASEHRHEFYVQATLEVLGQDRDVEFIGLKRQVASYLKTLGSEATPPSFGAMSCEMIADYLADVLAGHYPGRLISVEVSEDGENGAAVLRAPTPGEHS